MEYLFGLVFTLFKISIQASLYTFLLRQLARRYAPQNPGSWVARTSQNSSFKWCSRLVVGAALFAFSCTYWGDHGLGYARIPLGNGEAIEKIDLAAYFSATVPYEYPADQPYVESYLVSNEILCAKSLGEFYFTYDLETKSSRTFTSAEEYTSYAASRNLPTIGQFQSFSKQYNAYWGGWRFWLLA